jgi:hypothetical protein
MNERDKKMFWCLFISICGVHFCNGYSSNTIKDYQNKDYLVSSASNANRFEDNEIRGERTFSSSRALAR